MIKEKILELIMEIPEKFKGIIRAHFEYYKAVTFEQFVIVVSGICILLLLFFLLGLFLVFATFGLAFFIGKAMGNYAYGFFILSGFYLLLGLLFYWKRGPWIVNPVVRVIGKLFYSDESIFSNLVQKEEEVKDGEE